MPKKFPIRNLSLHEFNERLKELTSAKKPRRVVTPTGARARGLMPSNKSIGQARFESLVERDVARVLEVAPMVLRFQTHPLVLALPRNDQEQKAMNYTPDFVCQFEEGSLILEAKAKYFLGLAKPASRTKEIATQCAKYGLPFALILDDDVRESGLQSELQHLLHLRPLIGRKREGLDTSFWDPLDGPVPSAELLERWERAKDVCDDLLMRVMKRDPGELIAAALL